MKHRQLLRTAIAFMLAVMMTSLPAKAGKKFPSGYGVYEYDLTASVTIEVGEEKEIDPTKLNDTFYQILNNKASDGYYYHWDAYAAKISVDETYKNYNGEPNFFCATEIKEKQGDLIPGDKDGARYWFDTGCTIIGLNPGTSHITYEVRHYSHYASLSNNSREKVLSRLKVYVTVKESGKTQLTLTPSNTNKFVNKGTAITFSPNVSGATVYCGTGFSDFKSANKRRSVTIEKTSYVTVVAVKRGYATSELFEHTYYVEDGIFFNSNTPEGVPVQYKVTDETNNTCEVAYVPETATGTVTIPEEVKGFTVTGIKAQAFEKCSMDNLILPKTITVIGDSAFMGSKISSFTIPSHIQSIGKYAFARSALESITIPGSVETIEEYAFYDCGLVSLNILEGVTNIGENAFYNCAQLKTVSLPNTLKTIQKNAFDYCHVLNEIVIPHSVSFIGDRAFIRCSLTNIVIGRSVKEIGIYAFLGYGELQSVKSYIEEPFSPGHDVFNQNSSATLYVPKGTMTKYIKTAYWNKFSNIEEFEEDTKVNSISLNTTSLSLSIGDTQQLTAMISPEDATNKSVTWSSNNTSVATVNSSGLVTAVSEGTVTITCKANDGSGVTATCSITVKKIPIADVHHVSVTCDNTNLNALTNNDKLSFHATFTNYGDKDSIVTTLMICDKDLTRIIAHSDYEWMNIDTNQEETLEYDYALDTIPIGEYKATVMYYDWNKDIWIYNEKYIYDITIVNGYSKGDVNMDNAVNGTDIVALSNIVLGRKEKTESADVNGDGSVNGTDIVALSNIILGRGSNAPRRAGEAETGLSIEPFSIQAGEEKEMLIDLSNPNDEITLVQFDLHLPEGLSIKKNGTDLDIDMGNRTSWRKHTLDANETDGGYRFLLYSSSNTVIEGTSGAVIKVKVVADNSFKGGKIVIDNTLLVSPDEKETKPEAYEYAFPTVDDGSAKLAIEPFNIKAGEEKEMLIDLTNPNDEITLVQFDLQLPEGLTVKKSGADLVYDMADRTSWRKHTLDANETDGGYRFLLYSSSNTVIDGTSGAVIKVTLVANQDMSGKKIILDNILLVSPDEKETKPARYEYTIGTGTGIRNITMDSQADTPIYNLRGQRLAAPQKGINIIGGKKVVVK